MDKLAFGEKEQFADYQARYATYIVIERDRQIAVIGAPNGAFFPSGGETKGEETEEEAIICELIEETGIVAEISSYLGEANEYFYSNYHAIYYYNPGYFSVAGSWKRIGEPTEETNKIWWVSFQEVLVELKRGSHRRVVER